MSSAGRNPLMMLSIMLSAIVYTLDSTIAAVALPQMQGAFSATQDQIAWVLTSYIVTAAVFTPISGYLATRFGMRSMFLLCVGGFTVSSVMCGLSMSLDEMVLFRVLQGATGAALIPLSQAAILQAYSPAEYGRGMALFGVGVMLGPILGPTLGGWLIDVASWRWVFLINVPVGIVAMTGIAASMPAHTPDGEVRRFDWLGFSFLGLSIGSLQLMLDRGNSLSWFESLEIQVEALAAVLFGYLFLAQTFLKAQPLIDLKIFRNWNFSVSMLLSFTVGFNMMATMALLPPLMQNLLGYPVLVTGMILAPRGVGTMISMFVVGRLLTVMDARILILSGLAINTLAIAIMSTFDQNVTPGMLAWTGVIQGVGMGLMFVPMSSIAFSTLKPEFRNDGTALYSMGRNLGSSIGISILMGMLGVYVRENRSHLVDFVSPYNRALVDAMPGLMGPDPQSALGTLDGLVQQQAVMLGYLDDFRLMVAVSVISVPLVLMLRPLAGAGAPAEPTEAPDRTPASSGHAASSP
jgi:DHA2 family multidrug resistance protein